MKNANTYNRKTSLFVIVAILLAASSETWADANNNGAKQIVLRTIMLELNKNMQTVTDAISREDWEQMAKTAPLIADPSTAAAIGKGAHFEFRRFRCEQI